MVRARGEYRQGRVKLKRLTSQEIILSRHNVRNEPASLLREILVHLTPLLFETVLLLLEFLGAHVLESTLHPFQKCVDSFLQITGWLLALNHDSDALLSRSSE